MLLELEEHLLENTTVMKAMNLHKERLEEQSMKIAVDNASLRIIKEGL